MPISYPILPLPVLEAAAAGQEPGGQVGLVGKLALRCISIIQSVRPPQPKLLVSIPTRKA